MPKTTNQELKDLIAASVTALIERDNISRYKLANDLNVSESQISRICNAIYAPSLDMLVHLADYFNVTTDHILGRKE